MTWGQFERQWSVWRAPVTVEDGRDGSSTNTESFAAKIDDSTSALAPGYFPDQRGVADLELGGSTYTGSTKRITGGIGFFTKYLPSQLDRVLIGLAASSAPPAQEVAVAAKISSTTIELASDPFGGQNGTISPQSRLKRGQRTIWVPEHSHVAVRVFGKNSDNDTATMTIIGWGPAMETRDGPAGPGKGFVLWKGQIQLGSVSITSESPFAPGGAFAAGTWFEVDTFNDAVTGGQNPGGAYVLESLAQGILVLPTLGFPNLLMEITDIGGTNEMTEVGAIWKPISRGGVV